MKNKAKTQKFGFINVDKPSGIVSSTVVNKIKWLSGVPCGHMGTLDPLASGVLPIGIGNASRLFNYFLEKEKRYEATFAFGVDSDTLDSTGTLLYGGNVPSEDDIQAIIPTLLGDVMQIPPKYSAKNVNGKRGYDLARAGVEFELSPKQVRIESIKLLGKGEQENAYRFEIVCGGGTYIRSIARDMAAALGTKGIMSALRRTQSGCFLVKDAIAFSEIEKDPPIEELESYIIPTESVLPYEKLILSEKDSVKIFNGLAVNTDYADGLYKLYKDESFYGIAEVVNKKAKAKTKLC